LPEFSDPAARHLDEANLRGSWFITSKSAEMPTGGEACWSGWTPRRPSIVNVPLDERVVTDIQIIDRMPRAAIQHEAPRDDADIVQDREQTVVAGIILVPVAVSAAGAETRDCKAVLQSDIGAVCFSSTGVSLYLSTSRSLAIRTGACLVNHLIAAPSMVV
jgi:hypothetical protein